MLYDSCCQLTSKESLTCCLVLAWWIWPGDLRRYFILSCRICAILDLAFQLIELVDMGGLGWWNGCPCAQLRNLAVCFQHQSKGSRGHAQESVTAFEMDTRGMGRTPFREDGGFIPGQLEGLALRE